MIGVSSYLLINFWFTRIQANKSAIKAMVVNRVGDMFLSIAFFGLFWAFGNLDYATIYSLAPYMNETVLTIIGLLFLFAAMGKSAQLGLHSWLPDAMEGEISNICFEILTNLLFFYMLIQSLFLLNSFAQLIESITIEIWHLNIHDLKYYFCSQGDISMSILPPILALLPKNVLHTITGNMLGDGGIGYSNLKRDRIASGNARYGMTMDTYSYDYINFLFNTIYYNYSKSGLRPYPNPKLLKNQGKLVTQYHFNTRSLPLFTYLHSIWYVWNDDLNKFVKIIPKNLNSMFSVLSLAHWIMNDGYWDANTVVLCTESFTKEDCLLLLDLLAKLGIVAGLKLRSREKNVYRIRISTKSIALVKTLVLPYMHSNFLYKLNIATK